MECYTIGQFSKMTGIPVSTLRYYDKEGMFPYLERKGSIRIFGEREFDTLRVIECLKRSGLELREIRTFMCWCEQGAETYKKRRELFIRQKSRVEQEMAQLQRVYDMLTYKCWYYEQAIADGTEERVRTAHPADMPQDIRDAYENSHRA